MQDITIRVSGYNVSGVNTAGRPAAVDQGLPTDATGPSVEQVPGRPVLTPASADGTTTVVIPQAFPNQRVAITVSPASAAGAPVAMADLDTGSVQAGGEAGPVFPGAQSLPPVEGPVYAHQTGLEAVRAQAAHMPQITRNMILNDVKQMFGKTPERMALRYNLQTRPDLMARMPEVHRFATTALTELRDKVLANVDVNQGQYTLNPATVRPERLARATAQHVGYLAGILSRLPDVPHPPRPEVSRILLRSYFDGTLRDTRGQVTDRRAFLAGELAKAAGGSDVVRQFVMDPNHDYMFSEEALTPPGALLSNLASHYAGDATLEFAAHLLGDDRKAASLVKNIFARPDADIAQLLGTPQGPEGMIVQFAALANHEAWEWTKLGAAQVKAAEGDPAGESAWNSRLLGSTRDVLAEDPEAAAKVSDQITSYLLSEGKLIPCDRSGDPGSRPLGRLLSMIEANGIYAPGCGDLRLLSDDAVAVKHRLADEVEQAARVSDYRVGSEVAADAVANTCAAFAAQAVQADPVQKDDLVRLYRTGIQHFMPIVDELVSRPGGPSAKDDVYQDMYQNEVGRCAWETLKGELGPGRAHDLVRNASLANIIPLACKELKLPMRPDYTPQNLVADLAKMSGSILKDDYFLSKPDFMDQLRQEADRPAGAVQQADLENGIRLPNAMWMWTQLLRGLVENKPGRYTAADIDIKSDKFPAGAQLHPPDIRDNEIFDWAHHRLDRRADDDDSIDPNRQALAVVVLTLYKDLLQLRKGALEA